MVVLADVEPTEIFESLSDAVMVSRMDRVTGERVVEYVNPALERIVGCRKDDMVGRRVKDMFSPGSEEHRRWSDIDEWLRRGKAMRVQVETGTADGGTVHFDVSLSPLPSDAREFLVIGVGRPIREEAAPLVLDHLHGSARGGLHSADQTPSITRETFLAPDDRSGLAVFCAACSRLRTAKGDFKSPQEILREELGLEVSHGLCEGCFDDLNLP